MSPSPWLPLLVGAFAVLPSLGALRDPVYTLDEALLFVYPEQILAGDVPNKDFFTSYGPGGLSLLAVVYAVVGPSVLAERAVALTYHLAVAVGVSLMTRRHGHGVSASAGVMAALLMVPLGLTGTAWLGAVALTVWSLALLQTPRSRGPVALAGLLAGLAVAWRPETAAFALAAIPLLWRAKTWRPWTAGLVVGLLPLAAHAMLGGWQLYANVVDRAGVDAGRAWSSVPPGTLLLLCSLLVSVGYLVVQAVVRRSRVLASEATLAVLMTPQALQRIDLSHVLSVSVVVVPVALAQLMSGLGSWGRLLTDSFGRRTTVVTAWTAALATLGALTVIAAGSWLTTDRPYVTHHGRSLPVIDQSEKVALDTLVRQVNRHIRPGASIFVGAEDMSVPTVNDMRLYHLLPEYRQTAFNLEMPAPRTVGSALSADIRSSDALVLNHVPASWGRRLFPNVRRGDDEANRLVDADFCKVETVYAYTIFERCG
jgi:hypothetical protein